MHQISIEKITGRSRQEVRKQLAEIESLHKFYPLVKASPSQTGPPPTGKGAKSIYQKQQTHGRRF